MSSPSSKAWHRSWKFWVVVVVVLVGIGNLPDPDESDEPAAASSSTSVTPTPVADEATAGAEPEPEPELLFVTDLKDGDSWDASDGNEYRAGLVDTPERGETCSKEAAQFSRDFMASGFTVDAYSTDTYDRVVAEVFDADGDSLNVALAKSGLAGDRYLEEFRHENRELAGRIDAALASAASPSCRSTAPRSFANTEPKKAKPKPKPKAPKKNCAAGYSPCLPVVADLNCPEVPGPVTVTGGDQYGLDRDGDGIGCD